MLADAAAAIGAEPDVTEVAAAVAALIAALTTLLRDDLPVSGPCPSLSYAKGLLIIISIAEFGVGDAGFDVSSSL